MSGCGRSKSASCEDWCTTNESIDELTEINRRWKQEYDQLKTKHLKEKSALEEENVLLKAEMSKLKIELARMASNINQECLYENSQKNYHNPACKGHDNVEELMKEQLAAYREDFKLEHEDKEKIEWEKKSLQERLSQCQHHVEALMKELDVYKQECKRLQEEHDGHCKGINRHPSVDRSKSFPETSVLSYKTDAVDPMSSIALPPSMCNRRDGYLALRDFRHEQLRRGILVRNPSHGRSSHSQTFGVNTPSRRLSDTSSPTPPKSPPAPVCLKPVKNGRTSCTL